MKFIIKFLAIACLVVLSLEIFLRIASFIYAGNKFKKNEMNNFIEDSAYRIMFIGDSWTEGADAPPGNGYADKLITLLRKADSNLKIESFNFGKGCYNSSEATFAFLRHYKQIRPSLLIVLIGINNTWNTQDVALANIFFQKELGFNPEFSMRDKLFFKISKLRIVKLFKIVYFNLVISKKNLCGPLPINRYTGPYFEIASTGDIEKARDYLVKNIESASSYDDLYRVMLFSFNHDEEDVEDYLKKKGVWKPSLIKTRFDREKHDACIAMRYKLLDEHTSNLKAICDMHGIRMILQNYPYYNNPSVDELDIKLREIAGKLNIFFVDHYQYFTEVVGKDRWKRVQTYSHINNEGYALMAENLCNFIISKGLLQN